MAQRKTFLCSPTSGEPYFGADRGANCWTYAYADRGADAGADADANGRSHGAVLPSGPVSDASADADAICRADGEPS